MPDAGCLLLKRRALLLAVRVGFIWLAAAVLAAGQPAPAAETSAEASRLTVAILTFEDQSGDPDAAYWCYGIKRLLDEQLSEAKALRSVSAAFGYRQLQVKAGGPISVEQARQIGELVEARRVVWGSFRRDGQQWLVAARVLNVASGNAGKQLQAVAADWYDVRDQLGDQILKELGVKPSDAERQRMLRRGTSVPLALEWYSKAYAGQYEKRPKPELELSLRQALEADPQFADAHAALAAVLGSQGKFEPAEAAVRQALKLRPDSARAHQILGFALMFQQKLPDSETELRQALRLDPDDAETLMRLGECLKGQGQLEAAIACWNEAKRLNPTDAPTHAHLGDAYAKQRAREDALRELKEAERLEPEGVNPEQILWQGYAALHETPLALEHLEKFVKLARQEGLSPEMVDYVEQCARELKARLTPHEISATPPKSYTAQTLEAALRARLTKEEYQQIVNPLASIPAMDRWAQDLVRGATNDLGKARKVFDALARHLDTGESGTRAAQEVFAVWNDPAQSFCCQEYAKLYVALARAVGVKAFYVHLEKDYSGDVVYHDCAAVFAAGKAFLVDPAYQWFGAPHKEYLVLDDVQAVAHQYFQPSGKGNPVARCRLAAKLHPDSAWGQVRLASTLIKADDLTEASKALKIAQQLEPGRWDSWTCLGLLAVKAGDFGGAVADLRKALAINPNHGPSHFLLAWALDQQGKLAEARDEYRTALLYDSLLSSEDKAAVLRAIATINEKLPGESRR